MSATCPDPVYVAHLALRDAEGHLLAAQHLRVNATSTTTAKRRVRSALPGWDVVGVRPANDRDAQRWLHS